MENMYEVFESLCKLYDVTPYKVSQATGISRPTLTNWKNGKFNLKLENLQKIADYFDVPVGMFLGEDVTRPSHEEIRDKHQTNQLVNDFLKLDLDDRRTVEILISSLLQKDKYKKDNVQSGEVG